MKFKNVTNKFVLKIRISPCKEVRLKKLTNIKLKGKRKSFNLSLGSIHSPSKTQNLFNTTIGAIIKTK